MSRRIVRSVIVPVVVRIEADSPEQFNSSLRLLATSDIPHKKVYGGGYSYETMSVSKAREFIRDNRIAKGGKP